MPFRVASLSDFSQTQSFKFLKILIILAVVICGAAAALLIVVLERNARQRRLREAILGELQAVALQNCTFHRFGSANDGGYLMCENLVEPVDVANSYGIGSNADWDCEVARRYH